MALQRKTGLGKGWGALLQSEDIQVSKNANSNGPVAKDNTNAASAGSIHVINISQIAVNPFQPRTVFDEPALNELAESIRVQGLIQHITVRQVSNNEYQLISVERRLRAAKLAGIDEIPAY